MKRAQRNLFIIMTALIVFYSILTRLPWPAPLWVLGTVLAFALALIVYGRDFLIARYRTRRRRWHDAAVRYQRFEKKLLASRWPRLTIPLYLSFYSFDGVAVARNNVGQSLMNLEDLDGAQAWLRKALQRDPQYAVPYVNLGTIAAMRGDKDAAEREMLKAVRLGFSPAGAQRILRRALDHANATIGRSLD